MAMFTLEQIDDLHARLGNADTLAEYVRALQAIGVEKYDSYVTDGHSEYFGKEGQKAVSPPVHAALAIAEKSDKDVFLQHLQRHEQGQTTYIEMSEGLAESGIEKWTFDTRQMTIIYYDKAGNEMLVENLNA